MVGTGILIGVVRVYRWVLSPAMRFLFGSAGACRFSPTCSCYALEALERHGAWSGLRLTFWRLLRCHPWGGSGYDPVPATSDPNPDPVHSAHSQLGLLNQTGLEAGTKTRTGMDQTN